MTYAATSTRFITTNLGIDHNVNPREDLATHGPAAVKSGKITQQQLNRLKRLSAAHANAMEHFPFFVGAVLFATQAGLDAGLVNRYSLVYTVIRAAYALAYYYIEDHQKSFARSLLWWAGNVTCIRLFWFAGKAINAARGV